MSFIGRHISSLPTPALIVDKDKVTFLHFFIHSPGFSGPFKDL